MADEHDYVRREPSLGDPGPISEEPREPAPEGGKPEGTPEAEAAGAAPETTPNLEQLLREAERAAQEHRDAWLRAMAEVENVRKRAQIDIANAHKYGVENFASDLLPVKDSLEAALAAENSTLEAMRSGVELTLKQLAAVFERHHLKEIDPQGERFDPYRHQAISALPSDREPNTVINVLQKGYLLHDRLIRPALVTVAKAKEGEG